MSRRSSRPRSRSRSNEVAVPSEYANIAEVSSRRVPLVELCDGGVVSVLLLATRTADLAALRRVLRPPRQHSRVSKLCRNDVRELGVVALYRGVYGGQSAVLAFGPACPGYLQRLVTLLRPAVVVATGLCVCADIDALSVVVADPPGSLPVSPALRAALDALPDAMDSIPVAARPVVLSPLPSTSSAATTTSVPVSPTVGAATELDPSMVQCLARSVAHVLVVKGVVSQPRARCEFRAASTRTAWVLLRILRCWRPMVRRQPPPMRVLLLPAPLVACSSRDRVLALQRDVLRVTARHFASGTTSVCWTGPIGSGLSALAQHFFAKHSAGFSGIVSVTDNSGVPMSGLRAAVMLDAAPSSKMLEQQPDVIARESLMFASVLEGAIKWPHATVDAPLLLAQLYRAVPFGSPPLPARALANAMARGVLRRLWFNAAPGDQVVLVPQLTDNAVADILGVPTSHEIVPMLSGLADAVVAAAEAVRSGATTYPQLAAGLRRFTASRFFDRGHRFASDVARAWSEHPVTPYLTSVALMASRMIPTTLLPLTTSVAETWALRYGFVLPDSDDNADHADFHLLSTSMSASSHRRMFPIYRSLILQVAMPMPTFLEPALHQIVVLVDRLAVFRFNEPTTWPPLRPLWPHAEAMCQPLEPYIAVRHLPQEDIMGPRLLGLWLSALLLMRAFSSEHDRGDYAAAELLYLRLDQLYIRLHGVESMDHSTCLNNISLLYRKQGRYQESLVMITEALDIERRVNGEGSVTYGIKMVNRADCLKWLRRWEESEQGYHAALQLLEGIDDLGHSYAVAVNNLGTLYREWDERKAEQALEMYEKARALAEQQNHTNSSFYGTVLRNIAQTYGILGRVREAHQMFQQSLKLLRSLLGQTHPDVGIALGRYGRFLLDCGDKRKARDALRPAIAAMSPALDATHPDLVAARDDLAKCS